MPQNKEEFEFLGISRWHELGYKGQGIIIASCEKIIEDVFDDVCCLNYGSADSKYSKHGTLVMDYIRQVAPDALLWSANSNDTISNGELHSDAINCLMEIEPDFIGTANHSGFIDREEAIPHYQKLYDKGAYLLCSAGNEQKTLNKLTKGDLWKAVGACRYNKGNPKVVRDYADGEEMDFVSLDNLKSTWDNTRHKGTSFSYPLLMGMLGLVQCFFKEKTGKKLNHEQLNRFIIDNCIDLEERGHDIKTGQGLFILPEPTTIDISKYTEEDMEIKLRINNKLAHVNGKEVMLDTEPIIHCNRTMVPIRFIAETFGCKVEWNEKEREVTIVK